MSDSESDSMNTDEYIEIRFEMGLKIKDSNCNEYLKISSMGFDISQFEIDIDAFDFIPRFGIISGRSKFGGVCSPPVWVVNFHNTNTKEVANLVDIFDKTNHNKSWDVMSPMFIPHVIIHPDSKLKENDIIEFEHVFVKKIGNNQPHFVYKPRGYRDDHQ